jgi:hypothetical protein
VTARQSIDGQRVLIAEAHARGIKIIDATVLPIKGSFYDAGDSEAVRDALNEWIRISGEYDCRPRPRLGRRSGRSRQAHPGATALRLPSPVEEIRAAARMRNPPSVDFSVHHGEFPFTTVPRSHWRGSTASASPTRRC